MYTKAYSIDGKNREFRSFGNYKQYCIYPLRTTIFLELQLTIPEGGDKLEADLDW